MKQLAIITILTFSIFCCKNSKKTENPLAYDKVPIESLQIGLNPKSGSNVTGTVLFTQSENGVRMVAKIQGLSVGKHAIHLHEKSDCSSLDGKSTGGHWNPTAQPHGKWGNTNGYHKGDIGNFMVNDVNVTSLSFQTDEWCIGCGNPAKDILGKAVIVHQGEDDYTSQPSGAAGSRVSCAGIIH